MNDNDKNKISNQLSVESMINQAEAHVQKVVTSRKQAVGKEFIRRIRVGNHFYWQRCQHYYDVDDKRKLRILEHLGTRKPRGVK